MGSFRIPALSDLAVCKLYAEGFSRTEIGWRARLYDREILAILERNGIPLRSHADARALSAARRERTRERLRAARQTG
jgi:hypothetical protein